MVTVTSGETKLDWRTADAAAAFLPAGVAWNAAAVPESSRQTPSEHTRSRIQCRETIGVPLVCRWIHGATFRVAASYPESPHGGQRRPASPNARCLFT